MKTFIITPSGGSNIYVERINEENIPYTKEEGDELISLGDAQSAPYEGSILEFEKNSDSERIWRNDELLICDIEINKAEDLSGNFNALNWRAYRQELRDWPAHADFPDSSKHPTLT